MTCVLKLGGSLFSLADLRSRFDGLRARLDPAPLLVIGGGGLLADAIRQWQPLHRLSDAAAHDLCLQTLHISAHLLSHLLGLPPPVASLADLVSLRPGQACLVDVSPLVADEQDLPRDWSTTSDSLAAWLARQTNADTLILAKSADWPIEILPARRQSLVEASRRGLIDSHFPKLAPPIPRLGWINCRAAPTPPILWLD